MRTDYEVAIPSYQRRVTLASRTLPLLRRGGVDPARITVFVASAQERQAYAQALPVGLYGQIVVGVPGMGAIRNFINTHYPDGTRLLQIDDDLQAIQYVGADGELADVADLDALFGRGFDELDRMGATLFGFYPVANAFFMRGERVTTDLRYVVGAAFGVLNAHADHCQVTVDDKEDFERTLKHYLFAGKVVRFNDVCLKTKFYKEPGGMQVTRTVDRVLASAHLIAQRYPELATINDSKKSGYVELRLRDRRKKVSA